MTSSPPCLNSGSRGHCLVEVNLGVGVDGFLAPEPVLGVTSNAAAVDAATAAVPIAVFGNKVTRKYQVSQLDSVRGFLVFAAAAAAVSASIRGIEISGLQT